MPTAITIIGLGPGDPGLITRRAWQVMTDSSEIYLRTAHHPAAAHWSGKARICAFDNYYETLPDFASVYRAIVEDILRLGGRDEGVVYAVPGDPMVGEATVQEIRRRAKKAGMPLELVSGVSFVEACLAELGFDALDGLSIADALEVAARYHPPFPPHQPVLIGQLYARTVASEVKLTLMNQYPDGHPIWLIHHAGAPDARLERMALYDLDRSHQIGGLTALWVPPLEKESGFESFQGTVAHLRAPEGCPWDREQTARSLRQNLLEESYEALQAIDAQDYRALKEELGDLLLQIVLQTQIATEAGEFSMAEVIAGIQEKIIRRHPHVFGGSAVDTVGEVLHNWEKLKAEEREAQGWGKGALAGVPRILPALAQANEVQLRAARFGFDWPDIAGVVAKIAEELDEVARAGSRTAQAREMGDLLFAVVNYARWLKVDPEAALREAVERFRGRFARMERIARTQGRRLEEMALQELDDLWEAGKNQEKG